MFVLLVELRWSNVTYMSVSAPELCNYFGLAGYDLYS